MQSTNQLKFEYEEAIKCTQLPYNNEQTLKLQNSPIYTRYRKWLKDNGVLIDPRIRYPSYFGEPKKGVVGISASKPIEKKKAIVVVPYHLLITIDKVKEDLQLFQIVKDNVNFFKGDDDAALKLLILYMSNQLIKGEKSFYFPYFSISAEEYLSGWESKSLHMIENRTVMKSMSQQKEAMELSFMQFLRIFRRYENVFPQNITNTDYKAIFQKAYIFIITRAFGWSLPSISLIPLADSLNHSNIRYVNHFLVNIDQQKNFKNQQITNQNGYQPYTKLVNLDILKDQYFKLNEKELADLRKEQKSKSLKFIEKHIDLLIQSQKLLGKQTEKIINPKNKAQIRSKQYLILHQQYKAGIHKLKNLHFYQSSCDQDNDTDEDDIFDRELNHQKFSLDDKERYVTENKKQKQITKLWKLYIDNSSQEEESEEKVPQPPQNEKARKEMKEEIKQDLLKQNDSSEVSYEDSEDEDDPIYEWMSKADHKKTYFIMNTKDVIRQNEQIYNFYGRRSNQFLLVNYNFIMKNNIYDSYWLYIKLDEKIVKPIPASKLLQFIKKQENKVKSRAIKLKRYVVNVDLINICRSYIILWTKKQWNHCRLIVPFDRQIQVRTLELYQQIIKHLLNEFTTSIQEDEEQEENTELRYEERVAISLRTQYKRIIKGQRSLIAKCLQFVKKWQVKKVQKFEEAEMKWVQRIKPYLVLLESALTL